MVDQTWGYQRSLGKKGELLMDEFSTLSVSNHSILGDKMVLSQSQRIIQLPTIGIINVVLSIRGEAQRKLSVNKTKVILLK